MWVYEIKTGSLLYDTPEGVSVVTLGAYSGFERGKNNPSLQRERGVGPIPTGAYLIDTARDTPEHGPVVMPLLPLPPTEEYERSGFLIHGDSIATPGGASHGCIILPRPVRERISASNDRLLLVITGGV